ncbi:MAG TPA: ribosomal protein S18-alanine N-acetyltransferase [Thermodesulfobacteriota bacterium]|nr:ribosomal protein S18-alanine N-acetyltransferase [Thermodesulfobacteriota bacterium]
MPCIIKVVKFFTTMRPLPKYMIEDTRSEDLDDVMKIEEACFPTPWPRQIFEMELESTRSHMRVARVGGVTAGYIVAWMVYDEIHILNIAVHPDFRRMGLGEALLRDCLDHFFTKGAKHAILEVRRGNLSAQKLYEKLGFKAIGVRRKYYSDTGEDAIVMMLVMR